MNAMELFSLQYIIFILILMCLYYLLPALQSMLRRTSRLSFQWVILLAASLGLYAYLSGGALILMLLTSFTVWAAGLGLSRQETAYQSYRKDKSHSRDERKAYKVRITCRKRIILFFTLLLNFGILAYLKYFAVLLPIPAVSLFHASPSAETAAGVTAASAAGAASSLLLPLGISFYTFQAISYLIDQYNAKYPAERNPLKFLLFVSWFPQLLQGPIGRFDRLGPQLTGEHRFDPVRTRNGLLLILYGLMKKYAIADMLVTSIADILDSGEIAQLPGSLVVFAILLYSAQQYTDFSGGIDIVRGVSSLFGMDLDINFRQPYFSTSLGDFWRRWHITLGAWMRDYLFYPFALLKPMQRLGKWCTHHFGRHGRHLGRVLPAGIANIVVFLVVGIWHGPELHYVLWGLYNGVVIALSDLTEPFREGLSARLHWKTTSKGFHIFRILRTFVIVNIGWYFDRIYRFEDEMAAFRRTFTAFGAGQLADSIRSQVIAKSTLFNIAGGWSLAALGLVIVLMISLRDELTRPAGHRQARAGEVPTTGNAAPTAVRSTEAPAAAQTPSQAALGSTETPALRHFLSLPAAVRVLLTVLVITMIFASFMFTETAGGFLYANF